MFAVNTISFLDSDSTFIDFLITYILAGNSVKFVGICYIHNKFTGVPCNRKRVLAWITLLIKSIESRRSKVQIRYLVPIHVFIVNNLPRKQNNFCFSFVKKARKLATKVTRYIYLVTLLATKTWRHLLIFIGYTISEIERNSTI